LGNPNLKLKFKGNKMLKISDSQITMAGEREKLIKELSVLFYKFAERASESEEYSFDESIEELIENIYKVKESSVIKENIPKYLSMGRNRKTGEKTEAKKKAKKIKNKAKKKEKKVKEEKGEQND
jgi:translation initiation factor 2B subunit (eIF-2B alpha/beta/delta family)